MATIPFMNDDFLLGGPTARWLFHEVAKTLPIHDFHNHLDPTVLREDQNFPHLTALWLDQDHYKWRAMRQAGLSEQLITGEASPEEKLAAWAHTLSLAPGNPLFIWSHLELRALGIQEVLTPRTAKTIFRTASERLASKDYSARKLVEHFHVRTLGTTDDPSSELEAHKALSRENLSFSVRPTFRPDKLLTLQAPLFRRSLHEFSEAIGITIDNVEALWDALEVRMDYFYHLGCRSADQALPDTAFLEPSARSESLLNRLLKNEELTPTEALEVRSFLLVGLAQRYAERGWVMQLHLGALRNVNSRGLRHQGTDAGYDVMAGPLDLSSLSRFLNTLENKDQLPKTILYNLNPSDATPLAVLAGTFSHSVPGKVQLGAAWWFNDHQRGNQQQLAVLAEQGLLGTSVGMLTDSRSLLSLARHEYFRRIFCSQLGSWVDEGGFPEDESLLVPLVKGVCYDNAARFFSFEEPQS